MKPDHESDRVLLDYILECIDRIRTFTAEGRAAFFDSSLTQGAVLYNLQTLAESTQRLSNTLKSSEPGTRWEAIAGFRNILVHEYLGIDLETVWGIVENDLPDLELAIE